MTVAFVLSSPMLYRLLIRPFLFLFKPETAHHLVFNLLGVLDAIPGYTALTKRLHASAVHEAVTVAGVRFPNRVGLAAGFDKDAKRFRQLGALGFGFIEIGTVTPLPQEGNPKQRLFRLPLDHALINRMGFNNDGVDRIAVRLRNKHHGIIIGGNIGKNKVTANELASDDYRICFNTLFDHVDYFVVNVSSPNTPGLRELQEKEPLRKLLQELQDLNRSLSQQRKLPTRPIFLKIAPDLIDSQLDDVVEVVIQTRCAGVIATNTTIHRDNLLTPSQTVKGIGAGGLSGKPLCDRSTEVIRYLKNKSAGKIDIIGVGGIHSAKDAIEKLEAGASLIQLYTGFIYEGPGLITQIRKMILKRNK